MATIAMPHVGLGGHMPPAARVGRLLVEKGHRVIAWAPARYRSLVEASGAEFREHEPVVTRRPFAGILEFGAAVAEGTELCCGELIQQLLDESVELVIHDVHVPWGRVAADFLGLPRIVTNPLFPLLPGLPSGAIGPDGWPRVDQRVVDALQRIEASRTAIWQHWGVDLGGPLTTISSPGRLTLSFATEEILGNVRVPDGWHFVGPLLEPVSRAAPVSGSPLVYAAFGTFFNGTAARFRAVIDALADVPVEVLVSTGRGGVRPSDLEPLPANVSVREFVDSRQVLARAAVHVTHGGGNSVHESLLAGVPMLCLPQGSDQFAWSECVLRLGAGAQAEGGPAGIRAGVERLLGDAATHRRAREIGERLQAHPGPAMVVELVEGVLARSAMPTRLPGFGVRAGD